MGFSMLARHPLNTGFEWTDRPLSGLRRLSAAQVAQYNNDGYCILYHCLSPGTVRALLSEIDPIESGLAGYVISLDGGQTIAYDADNMTFTTGLVGRAPSIRALCRAALIQDLVFDLIGPDVRLYWDQAVYKKPEKGRIFPWHQDNGYTFVEPQNYLTCWIALNDATLDNGCPWVIPGLHRGGTLNHVMGANGLEIERLEDGSGMDRAQAVPLAAGDMVLFSSLTPHRTGANRTSAVRKALILQFAPDGTARILENSERSVQADPIRNLPILKDGTPVVD